MMFGLLSFLNEPEKNIFGYNEQNVNTIEITCDRGLAHAITENNVVIFQPFPLLCVFCDSPCCSCVRKIEVDMVRAFAASSFQFIKYATRCWELLCYLMSD